MKKIISCVLVLLTVILLCLPFFQASAESYIIGDVDGDGSVTIIDATVAQRIIAFMVTDTDGEYTKRGDVDGDSVLSTIDVTWIKRHCAFMDDIPYPIAQEVTDAPTEPAPTEPAPTEPAPTEPAPTEPAPTEPAPTQPAPTQPAPTVLPTAKPDPYELPPI